MSGNDTIQKRISKKFVSNLNELYPQETSFNKKTKRLNEVLEEMLYGKKK
ncbi:hypothetical protein LCGC14_0867790 [marine sediment metagenome]|uniref:Uncharacterized protein n=1 Tax=marine sediment metagenome TaxID=412755 RepID=A0A0F9PAG0_9ZZZZ